MLIVAGKNHKSIPKLIEASHFQRPKMSPSVELFPKPKSVHQRRKNPINHTMEYLAQKCLSSH